MWFKQEAIHLGMVYSSYQNGDLISFMRFTMVNSDLYGKYEGTIVFIYRSWEMLGLMSTPD